MKSLRKRRVLPGTFLLLRLLLLIPVKGQAEESIGKAAWTPLYQGVEYQQVALIQPRPLQIHLLKLRMDAPGLEWVATPGNGGDPGETTSQRTSNFLSGQRCQLAINAGPFDIVSSREGLPMNITGLHISKSKLVSPDSGYPVLYRTLDGTAGIGKQPLPVTRIQEAVCGFQIILKSGAVTATDTKLHPRTGAGVSSDGKTVWLLVADGRQPGYSEGCTTLEMAEWFKILGADAAINLDGGGTTTMVKQGAEGKALILNRPIHGGIPGQERPAGSHLGIRARPLPSPR